LPEVVGDAGVFFDPRDVSAMAGAISRLLTDEAGRDELARRALERAARFTWAATARALLETFDGLDPAWTPRSPDRIFHRGQDHGRMHRDELRRQDPYQSQAS
jgi:hypothetical protein